MATMREFLTSGSLGEITPGLTIDRVESVLGPPEDRSVQRNPLILRYGSLQLTFRRIDSDSDSKLVSMAMYFEDCKRALPAVITLTDWSPSCGANEEEFREFLSRSGLAFHSKISGEENHLSLSSGIQAVFVRGKLHSIHVKQPRAERKQLSVSLPAEVVDLLRERSREQRISVQEVMEKLIVQGTRAGG